MSKATEEELRLCVCDQNRCWVDEKLEDGGVMADLKGPWKILLLDDHFAACVKPANRIGGLCDGVAVLPQERSRALRILEVKRSLEDLPKAKAQLKKGAELVSSKLEKGFDGLRVSIELHVLQSPRTTIKSLQSIKVNNKKLRVVAFKNGVAI